jgi:NAD+ synthase (glutamine-hydrolysing)
VRDIIKSGITNNIVCEFGCPILHKAALYNGRVIIHNSKVIAVRVKLILADGENYFETRHFAAWKDSRAIG